MDADTVSFTPLFDDGVRWQNLPVIAVAWSTGLVVASKLASGTWIDVSGNVVSGEQFNRLPVVHWA